MNDYNHDTINLFDLDDDQFSETLTYSVTVTLYLYLKAFGIDKVVLSFYECGDTVFENVDMDLNLNSLKEVLPELVDCAITIFNRAGFNAVGLSFPAIPTADDPMHIEWLKMREKEVYSMTFMTLLLAVEHFLDKHVDYTEEAILYVG